MELPDISPERASSTLSYLSDNILAKLPQLKRNRAYRNHHRKLRNLLSKSKETDRTEVSLERNDSFLPDINQTLETQPSLEVPLDAQHYTPYGENPEPIDTQ